MEVLTGTNALQQLLEATTDSPAYILTEADILWMKWSLIAIGALLVVVIVLLIVLIIVAAVCNNSGSDRERIQYNSNGLRVYPKDERFFDVAEYRKNTRETERPANEPVFTTRQEPGITADESLINEPIVYQYPPAVSSRPRPITQQSPTRQQRQSSPIRNESQKEVLLRPTSLPPPEPVHPDMYRSAEEHVQASVSHRASPVHRNEPQHPANRSSTPDLPNQSNVSVQTMSPVFTANYETSQGKGFNREFDKANRHRKH